MVKFKYLFVVLLIALSFNTNAQPKPTKDTTVISHISREDLVEILLVVSSMARQEGHKDVADILKITSQSIDLQIDYDLANGCRIWTSYISIQLQLMQELKKENK